ncbi:MAG: tetratricopeptide repeat protein [Paludibacter sp.]|jgi:tetratricopeptide (TPR) repeat protein|nr:tetratricopeptide repeat protein [Paludibacter sp.]
MKHILIIIAIFFACNSAFYAQSNEIKQANALYADGNFTDAALAYEAIIDSFGVAPQIYLNLGNAYYKSNETALAILNYERALKLNSHYEAAKINLSLAQQKVIDNVAQIPTFFLRRWVQNFVQIFESNEWFFISITAFALCIAAILFFIFGYSKDARKLSFYLAITLFIVVVSSATFSIVQKNALLNHNSAIVLEGTIIVKSSPDRSGTDLFQLHEGTKVVIRSTLDEWVEIAAGSSNVGWVERSAVEAI